MLFRLLILLLINLVCSQTLYDSVSGYRFSSFSARSSVLGSSSSLTDTSPLGFHINPANISNNSKSNFLISSGYILNSNLERRGFVVKDYFGDYLTESDYVKNSSNYNYFPIGIKLDRKYEKLKISLVASLTPHSNYNYRYEEEVRGSLSAIDGQIFSRDPLVGYHIFETKGEQQLISMGSALLINLLDDLSISAGLSLNSLQESEISEKLYVDKIIEDSEQISGLDSYSVSYTLDKTQFISLGTTIRKRNFQFSFSFEPKIIINKEINIEDLSTLSANKDDIISLYGNNSLGINYFEDYYNLKVSDIEKPMIYSIALGLLDEENNGYSFTVHYERKEHTKSYNLSSCDKLSIGIEHFTVNKVPIRFGIEYRTLPFQAQISSVNTISLGSGYKVNNLILDYGVSYSSIKYNYPDFFPLENEYRPDLDVINNENINFITSLTYYIK